MTTGLVGQHQLTTFTAPVPGDPLNATVVLGNDNDTVTAYDAHDDDSTIHVQSSTLASRPPASIAGQKWLTTDTGARYLYYDTGSAWVEVDYFRDTGGTIVGDVTVTGNVSISGTLGVTGVATLTAQPIVSSLTASKPVFTDASKGLVSTGTLGTDQGGTNLTTYTTGDILYASATNVLSKLAIGTTGQHLIVSGGVPAWSTDSALGTVTSVSWTGGLVSVATATTTPAFTVAGTSGGIPYFSSASTWASSAALTQYGIVYGGGAGATPVATAAGTTGQVLTAVTSGAPVWSATYAGTVTSVGFTGGLISVATATTTPALTVAGTSGGVVYFSSASTWASSAALTASAIVVGGGAGAAPATTTTGTGVVTALGVNVGTAGAFVVNGGALGTPSSGAVAASLITAGTFGAGAYTFPSTLAVSGQTTITTTGGAGAGPAAFNIAIPVTDASFVYASQTLASALTTTHKVGHWIGRAESANNSGYFAFHYIGAGSASNYMSIGMYAADDLLKITAGGAATFSGAVSTGALTATTGAFSGNITRTHAAGTESQWLDVTTGVSGFAWGFNDTAGTGAYGAGAQKAYIASNNGYAIQTLIAATTITTVSSTGLAVVGTLSVTGAATTAGVLSRTHAQGTDGYLVVATTGKNNTVMGYNDSGGTLYGVPTGSAYIGTLNGYNTCITDGTNLIATFAATTKAATFAGTLAVTGAATVSSSINSATATAENLGNGGASTTLTSNATANLCAASAGFVCIYDSGATGTAAMISVNSTGSILIGGNSTNYSGTKDTASKINVYYESGNIVVQNKYSGTTTVRTIVFKVQ